MTAGSTPDQVHVPAAAFFEKSTHEGGHMLGSLLNKGKEAVVNTAISTALNTVVKLYGSQYLDGILTIKSISYPTVVFTLEGLPNQEFKAEVGSVEISEPGDAVMLSDFRSDTAFIATALNRFVPKVIMVEDPKVQLALRTVRGVL